MIHVTCDRELFLTDVFLTSEILDMRHADHGDGTDRRSCDLRQPFHLAGFTHAHFQDCALRIFIHMKQGNGKTDLRVVVFLRLINTRAAGKCRGDHLTRRGLSDASGDTDHRDIKLIPEIRADVLHGFFCILHGDVGLIRDHNAAVFLRQCCRRLRECGLDEHVTVIAFPHDGDEQVALLRQA